MDKFPTENLILLEFLVDQVNLEPKVQQDLKHVNGEKCVSFQFLDNSPLLVCEEDFSPKKQYEESETNIKNGKSCLFSMTPEQCTSGLKKFDIFVEVFKKLKPGTSPDKIPIGESLISIANLFSQLVKAVKQQDAQQPSAKALKDTFKITDSKGEEIGHIGVYVRMSCFGKLIVTQFQMNLEDKSVEFKAKEGHYLFKYNKGGDHNQRPKSQSDYNSRGSIISMRNANPQMSGMGMNPTNYQQHPMNQARPMSQQNPAMMNNNMGWNNNMNGNNGNYNRPYSQPIHQSRMNRELALYEMPINECGPCLDPNNINASYQEISTEMGGKSLTVRIHKDPISGNYDSAVDEDIRRPATSPACYRPPSANQQSTSTPQPFNFRVGGNDQNRGNNVCVSPPCGIKPDGTRYTEISDAKKDVFVLRIGKKTDHGAKKNNIELEFCTPNLQIPIGCTLRKPDLCTNECQVNDEVVCPSSKSICPDYGKTNGGEDGGGRNGRGGNGKGGNGKGGSGKDGNGKGKGGKGASGKGAGGKGAAGKGGKGKGGKGGNGGDGDDDDEVDEYGNSMRGGKSVKARRDSDGDGNGRHGKGGKGKGGRNGSGGGGAGGGGSGGRGGRGLDNYVLVPPPVYIPKDLKRCDPCDPCCRRGCIDESFVCYPGLGSASPPPLPPCPPCCYNTPCGNRTCP